MQQTKKVPVTFTVELAQLQRLDDVVTRTRQNRSTIVRDAIELVLARYEDNGSATVDGGQVVGGGVVRRKTARRRR